MNKCRAIGRRKYEFPDTCLLDFFHVVICTTTSGHLLQYWALLFLATLDKCTGLRKYAFPEPCLLVFFCFGKYYHLSKYSTLLTPCIYSLIKEGWEEGRVENVEFAVKDQPLGRTLWLIYDWYIYIYNARQMQEVAWAIQQCSQWAEQSGCLAVRTCSRNSWAHISYLLPHFFQSLLSFCITPLHTLHCIAYL